MTTPQGVNVSYTDEKGELWEAEVRSDFVGLKVSAALKVVVEENWAPPKQPITLNGKRVAKNSARILQAGDNFSIDP